MNFDCKECGTEFRRVGKSPFCSSLCRFLDKVEMSDPAQCWEWTSAKHPDGYGVFGSQSPTGYRMVYAHRWVYEYAVGPIPQGLQIDHLCRNRGCVNPDHLEVVTSRENTLRGEAPNIVINRTGVCKRGHSMGDAYENNQGTRQCRTCRSEYRQRADMVV